jgi:hypothetical protein
MPLYKFDRNDVFRNQIKTFPTINLFTYTGSTFYNNQIAESGAFSYNINGIPILPPSSSWSGSISLFELNIDPAPGSYISASMIKGSNREGFKHRLPHGFGTLKQRIDEENLEYSRAAFGDEFAKHYPMSASVTNAFYSAISPSATSRTGSANYFSSLMQPIKKYTILNRNFIFSSSGNWDKGRQEMRLISVPSIFYGSSIAKGTVSLKFIINGTASQEVTDYYKDGTLRVTGSTSDDGKIAGVVLYDEGIFMLTGSWNIVNDWQDDYNEDGNLEYPRWTYFGVTSSATTGSSFHMAFSGTNYVPVVTMLAHAPKGQLNQSNNPTFVVSGSSRLAYTGSTAYRENKSLPIKNITKSNLTGALVSASFEKTTFISKVGIYDKDKNLIGLAKMATPVRKREIDEFTFKLKLDF